MNAAAYLYGGSVIAAGSLLASGLAAARRERLRDRFSPPTMSQGTPDLASRISTTSAAVVAGVGAVAAFGWVLAGPAGGGAAAVAAVVGWRSRSRRSDEQRQELAERQLRDAVVALAAALRAGHSIRRALAEAIRDADHPLRGALDEASAALEVGEPLRVALARLDERVPSSDARLLAGVLTLHARTGGDLPGLLDEVAELLAQRVEERRHVRALTAQARTSGAVLAALPVAFVALLSGAGGDGLGDFYRTPLGATLLGAALLAEAVGFAWMRGIARGAEVDR